MVGREGRLLRTAERHGALRGVEDQRPGEVDQWVADRRHLPVDDSQEPGRRVGGEEDVVELVVAVAQRERLLGGWVVAQPASQLVRSLQLPAAIGGELIEPPLDLVGDVAVASRREIPEAARRPVDRLYRDQRVDQLLERGTLLLRVIGPRSRDRRE